MTQAQGSLCLNIGHMIISQAKNVIYNKVPNLDSYTLQELLPVAHFHSAAHCQPVATKENMGNN